MDQADAESSEGRDSEEDPHYRWPDDISELEESSCASPLPGTSRETQWSIECEKPEGMSAIKRNMSALKN